MQAIFYKIKNNSLVYFLYYLKKSNWKKLIREAKFVNNKYKIPKIKLYLDMVFSALVLGFSFHEYFYYSFYIKNRSERMKFASMSYMYEFQLNNNQKKYRFYLEDKIIFLKEYGNYIGREWLSLEKCTLNELEAFLVEKSKVVLKNSKGGAGKNVAVFSLKDHTAASLQDYAYQHHFDLVEEFVFQHPSLMKLSPNSLNTIRLITQLNRVGQVEIIGTILRMGIDLNTDNLSTGGIACPINLETGKLCGHGISFDITKPDYFSHPVSGLEFIGFQIPYWSEVKEICLSAAMLHPENKSIGWDVAIKNDGPILIEGNHDWGARLWQMPGKVGLKHVAKKYFR